MLARTHPVWEQWDEEGYSVALGYAAARRPTRSRWCCRSGNVNTRLLASLSPEQWARTAVHPTGGEIDVAGWVAVGGGHLKRHVLQARRAVMGMI